MKHVYTFTIDKKNNLMRFGDDYPFPIEYFADFIRGEGISSGLVHLRKKSWISDDLYEKVFIWVKSSFPQYDFSPTLKYIEERDAYVNEVFKNMRIKFYGE